MSENTSPNKHECPLSTGRPCSFAKRMVGTTNMTVSQSQKERLATQQPPPEKRARNDAQNTQREEQGASGVDCPAPVLRSLSQFSDDWHPGQRSEVLEGVVNDYTGTEADQEYTDETINDGEMAAGEDAVQTHTEDDEDDDDLDILVMFQSAVKRGNVIAASQVSVKKEEPDEEKAGQPRNEEQETAVVEGLVALADTVAQPSRPGPPNTHLPPLRKFKEWPGEVIVTLNGMKIKIFRSEVANIAAAVSCTGVSIGEPSTAQQHLESIGQQVAIIQIFGLNFSNINELDQTQRFPLIIQDAVCRAFSHFGCTLDADQYMYQLLLIRQGGQGGKRDSEMWVYKETIYANGAVVPRKACTDEIGYAVANKIIAISPDSHVPRCVFHLQVSVFRPHSHDDDTHTQHLP